MVSEIYTHKNTSPKPCANNGLLAGRRVVIQPNMSACGWLSDAGSPALEGFVALEDATVVARMRDAGAELVGSSRMSELGFGLAGDTANRILSGGEADIALVTDTMGEARVAAAGSAVFGFKPSFGMVSRSGLVGLVPSMECYGILGKKMEDIIDTLSVIAGKDKDDPSMPDETFPDFAAARKPLKMPCTAGVLKECVDLLQDRERKAFRTGLARLEEAGLTIREVNFSEFDLFRVVHHIVASVEASSSAGKYDGVRYGHRSSSGKNWNEMYLNSRGESFGSGIKTFLFQGAYFQFESYPAFENACRNRRRLVRTSADLLGSVDLLVFPTRRLEHDAWRAATINHIYDAFLLTLPANVTGQPSLHVPSLALHAGTDIGVQLVGLRLDDPRLLSIGMKLSSTAQGGASHEV
jgi:aspartyl-tRNA(Asn)/glutamyl-tRNA(Gln) amidotransferase subunit A